MKLIWKDTLRLSAIPVLIASLCCLSPVILVLLGLATASFASSLADTLYGDYKWVFRGVGLLALAGALYWYTTRRRGICTLDEVKRRRNEIINYVAVAFIVTVLGYLIFLHVIVHYIGVWMGLWV